MNENEKKMFLGLYQMLLADAEVHPNELELLYQIGKEKGGISEEEIQRAIFSPNTVISLETLSDEGRIEYLYNLSRIAWADGKIDDKEKDILEDASKRLGFAEENVTEIAEFLLEQAKGKMPFEEVLQIIKNS
ncbi:TerB family tellurite resistance protein [Saccharicrinis sp. FJH62]|uniref:TerB family tellurite resistance protein n=1 Tax=Saccharicrinis sp. FJH62 TaxID=3344657 RepID=UPI0035D3F965